MGKMDTIIKEYIENPVVFADAFNQFLYHGDQKVDPARLKELDTTGMRHIVSWALKTRRRSIMPSLSGTVFMISSSCPIRSAKPPVP